MLNYKSKLTFKAYTPNQTRLFPQSLDERIEPNHPVRIVNNIIDQINIDPLIAKYKGGGTSSYHPRLMLKVLVYAYLRNIYSSRKIEAALNESIHFMWLSDDSIPDHNTINRFRSDRLKDVLKDIFSQIVLLLVEHGLLSLKEIYLDGTKVEANANRYSFVWKKSINTHKQRIKDQLSELWEYTQQIAAEEMADSGPIELEEIAPDKVAEAINRIDQVLKDKQVPRKIRKKVKYAKRHWPEKIKKYEQHGKTLGERNSYSKIDPDATFMPMKEDHLGNGQLKPAYNWQISTSDQFIVNYSIHQTTNDINTLIPHLEEYKELYQKNPVSVSTDAGYGSEENYEYLENEQIKNFVKYYHFHKEQTQNWDQDPFRSENLYYNQNKDCLYCPIGQQMNKIGEKIRLSRNGYEQKVVEYQAQNCHDCPMRGPCFKGKGNRVVTISHKLRKHQKKARENLLSEEGLRHRSKRPVDVEPVFGMIKHNKGFRRFMLRGLDKAHIEAGLISIAHNITKMVA
jgi:transposase